MSKLRCDISMSLDGFIAGPNPTLEDPLGEDGESLHEWVFPLAAWRAPHGLEGGEINASSAVLEESLAGRGATIMGRNMYGGGPGPWGENPWNGWWGENPPFHHPVFVLTHYAREPVAMECGTTFTFVTEGIGFALDQAKEAADGRDVHVAGGADVIQQYLAERLIDDLEIHLVPILLGSGTRLFDNLAGADPGLEPVRTVEAPGVTHLKYRVVKQAR